MKDLRIEIDDKSGFCFGVVRAISEAEKALAGGETVYSLGDIVHNRIEVQRLEKLGLYHVEHLTPEAKQQGEALLREGYRTYIIDDAELERVKRSYPVIWKDPAAAPQLCFVGCPHLTLEQLKDWTAKLTDALRAQNRLQVAVPTVFTAAPAVLDAFKDTVEGYKLQSMGVILSYICPLMYMNNPLCKKKAVITNSNKLRTYTSARYYTDAEILDILTGKEGR